MGVKQLLDQMRRPGLVGMGWRRQGGRAVAGTVSQGAEGLEAAPSAETQDSRALRGSGPGLLATHILATNGRALWSQSAQ